ncbi:MAG: carboxypeptidase M32 [Bacteroidota bacterium]
MSVSIQQYEKLKNKLQQIADIKYAAAVLQWDQETYLPAKGNDARGRQIATLSEISHQQFTDEKTGNLLLELLNCNDLSDTQKRNIQLSNDDYIKSKKLPSAFVRKSSEVINKSFHSWISARKENNFDLFKNPLQEVIEIKKQEAEYLGYTDHPYDALMNEYDKGLTVKFTDELFSSLKPELSSILAEIKNCPQVDNHFLHRHYDKSTQWNFGMNLLKSMHFDFEAGRQDISEHPFTTNFSSKDVRVTTRIDENDFANMTWSCIHEGGHALYEQGLPDEEYGMPLGEYCSLSIHESQSRLWENCIGRGLPFWTHQYLPLQNLFPDQLKNISLNQFYNGINKVSSSLIRTEADELTYHFHVMIRYEIEKLLIDGTIMSKDIPSIWNELYDKYLGVKVPDDKNGCLQDVHWSHGSFGYFATYSIGSLYAAQFWSAIKKDILNVEQMLISGNSLPVFNWLQQHIYPFGRYYHSAELCKKATGEILDSKYFIEYAKQKFYDIYKKLHQ